MREEKRLTVLMFIWIFIGFLITTPTTPIVQIETNIVNMQDDLQSDTRIPIREANGDPIFNEYNVSMRDGVRLYTRVFLPGPEEYPVILERTPYGIGTPTWEGGVPPDPAVPTQWPDEVWNGYVYVFQDTRGRFFSEGVYRYGYDEINDSYDTIDWIANQDWCDGNIGVSGYSAPGVNAFFAAAEPHPNLKAIAPLSSSGSVMNDLTYDGGAFRGDMVWWGILQTVMGLSASHLETVVPPGEQPNINYHILQIASIFQDLMVNLEWHNPTSPNWPDCPNATGSEWWMHLPMYNMSHSYSILQPYVNEVISHPDRDAWRNRFEVYDDITVPTLLLTGWYDFFPKCQIDAFINLQSRGVPVKLIVGNGTHMTDIADSPYYEWFDYWLKGIDTKIMDEPPIYYYSLGADEWRWGNQWPVRGTEKIKCYLHDGGLLSIFPCADGEISDSFIYDPMDPVLTMGGTNLVITSGSFDQTPTVLGRDDILSYTTPPLTEDVEIAGPLKVCLSVSSNCTDTDFTAKLIDVHPGGEAMLVADGIIRARYRNSMADPELMSGDPNDIYNITVDIGDIGQVFKAGHCIRVDISSSNFPKYSRNLNTGGELHTETEMLVADNTVHHNAENLSYIVFPVITSPPSFSPTLTLESLDPKKGNQFTEFIFTVNYTDPNDQVPSYINVVINGTVYAMEKENDLDTNFMDGCIYQCITTLAPAAHNYTYYFECSDGYFNDTTGTYDDLYVFKVLVPASVDDDDDDEDEFEFLAPTLIIVGSTSAIGVTGVAIYLIRKRRLKLKR